MRFFRDLMFVAAAVCVVGVSAEEAKLDFDEMIDNLNKRRADLQNKCSLPKSLVPKKLNSEFIIFDLDNFGVCDLSTRDSRNLRIEGNDLVATGNEKVFIKFPTDGHQPTAAEAGVYSGARVTKEEDSKKVTSWYMYVFGGKEAEEYMGNDLPKVSRKDAVYPSFGIDGRNIITVGDDTTPDKKKLKNVFWSRFKKIASDPVGRVLLYRLLIEIRRCQGGNGVVEPGIKIDKKGLEDRNFSRSIYIEEGSQKRPDNPGGYFWPGEQDPKELKRRGVSWRDPAVGTVSEGYISRPTVVGVFEYEKAKLHLNGRLVTGEISTVQTIGRESDYPKDISLFHEMLHWFHYLRDQKRFITDNKKVELPYGYVFECYYGKMRNYRQQMNTLQRKKALQQRVALSLWEYKGRYEGEEVRTILGIPSAENDDLRGLMPMYTRKRSIFTNDENFLNGDELSENVYRLSRSEGRTTYKMRFGHNSTSFDGVDMTLNGGMFLQTNGLAPNAFKLAHRVAMNCYKDITGTEKKGWNLAAGQAAEDLGSEGAH